MTVSNTDKCVNVNDLIDSMVITFICPICNTQKDLRFPKSVVDESKNLTTISIPKGLVCEHHFQAFIDKNYQIRGYQKVDFEFSPTSKKKPQRHRKSRLIKSDEDLFKNLFIEGNYAEYYPEHLKTKKKINSYHKNELDQNPKQEKKIFSQKSKKIQNKPNNPFDQFKERSLKEIYEDFCEFIDENNETFIDFIIEDPRKNLNL